MRFVLTTAVPLLLLLPAAAMAQVPGSYRRSCSNITQDGPILSAVCQGSNEQMYQTSLDLSRCGGTPVSNIRGRLVCGFAQGSARPIGPRYTPYGDGGPPPYGYDRPPPPRYIPPRYRPPPPDQDDGYPPPPPPRRRFIPDPDE